MHWLLMAVISVASLNVTRADWQNTNWTMSRAEVIRATGATAINGTPGDRVHDADLGAKGEYQALGFDFSSLFFFDQADRLRVVKLVAVDPARCDELGRTMAGLYGAPIDRTRVGTVRSEVWIDHASGDRVRFTQLDTPRDCFVVYRPGAPSGASGL